MPLFPGFPAVTSSGCRTAVGAVTVTCGAAKLWDGCFEAGNMDSAAFLAAFGPGAYPEPGSAVLHSSKPGCSRNESLGCTAGSRVGDARGWGDLAFAAAAGGGSHSSGAELSPLRHLPAFVLRNNLSAGR